MTATIRAPLAQGTVTPPAARKRPHLLVVVYLVCVTVPISMQVGPIYLTTLRVLLLAVTLPMLVRLLTGAYGRVVATDWLFLGHAVWIALALAANDPGRALQQAPSVGVEFLGGYVIARACIRDPGDFLALCRLLVALVLATLPFALMEARSGSPPILEMIRALPVVGTVPIVHIEGRMGLERVQANFAHPIHYGLFCSVAFSMALVALRGTVTTARRYATAAAVALCGFLALSSGALLAIALQMALIAWATIFDRVRMRWWILIGLFALAWVVIDILSNRSPMRVFMSYATFSAHNAYWRGIIFEWGVMNIFGNAAEGIPPARLFGIGLGDWVRPHFMYSGSMDNYWLVMGVRYGVPGFALVAAGWLAGLGRVIAKPLPKGEVALIRRAYAFTFVGLTLTLCTVHVWTNVYSFVFFFFGAGLWLVHWAPDEAGAEPRADAPSPRAAPAFTRFPPAATARAGAT